MTECSVKRKSEIRIGESTLAVSLLAATGWYNQFPLKQTFSLMAPCAVCCNQTSGCTGSSSHKPTQSLTNLQLNTHLSEKNQHEHKWVMGWSDAMSCHKGGNWIRLMLLLDQAFLKIQCDDVFMGKHTRLFSYWHCQEITGFLDFWMSKHSIISMTLSLPQKWALDFFIFLSTSAVLLHRQMSRKQICANVLKLAKDKSKTV